MLSASRRSPGSAKRPSASGSTSPSATSPSSARSSWARSARPRRSRPGAPGRRPSRSTASSRPRHCRSVPSYFCVRRLAARPRPAGAGPARGQPGAVAGHRAAAAARAGRRAHQRAQLHHRDRPAGRHRGLGGQQRFGQPPLRHRSRRGRGRGYRLPSDQPGQHPPHVGVEHGVPLAEGEAGHGRGGVAPDPRQRAQGVHVGGHRPAVASVTIVAVSCSRSARRG